MGMENKSTIVTDVNTLKTGDRIRHTRDMLGEPRVGTVLEIASDGDIRVLWDGMPDLIALLPNDPFFGEHVVELI